MSMKKLLATSFLCLGISSVSWAERFFPEAGVDETPSLGKFVITFTKPVVRDAHTNPYTEYPHLKFFCPDRDWSIEGQEEPRCEDKDRTTVSPYMYQAVTKIGRSQPHNHGDRTDTLTGAKVCAEGGLDFCGRFFPLRIKDTDFGWVPKLGREKDFSQGPTEAQALAGIIPEEVHTQMLSLDLKPIWPPYNSQEEYESANRVRAGANTPEQAPSLGEVESLSEDGLGFPGESFFNMNVEIDLDLDQDGQVDYTLKNPPDDPLIVQGYGLMKFPPELVYVHNTTIWAVPLFNKQHMGEPCQKDKIAGCHMAWVRMAGHGIVPGKSANSDWEVKQGTRNAKRDSKIELPVDFTETLDQLINDYKPVFEGIFKKMPALPIPPDEEPIPIETECTDEDCLQPINSPQPVCELTDDCDIPQLIELESVTAFTLDNKVFLVWETLSEMHNLGFHVLRARKAKEDETAIAHQLPDGTLVTEIQQLTPELIPSRGISFWGISYSYADHTVQPGETYYYAIKDLDEEGKETIHLKEDNIVSVTIPPLAK